VDEALDRGAKAKRGEDAAPDKTGGKGAAAAAAAAKLGAPKGKGGKGGRR
jgi:hypothetical protein